MCVSLADVEISDLSDYVFLENKTDLSYFMSRTRPYQYDSKTQSTLFWRYITLHSIRIGALWIEKEPEDITVATLGIFIADQKNLCRGIGAIAIEMAIVQAKEIMDFNQIELHVRDSNIRAIRCYIKCGFYEAGRFTKEYLDENVEVMVMRRDA